MPKFSTLSLGSIRPAGWIRHQMQNDLEHGFAGCLDALTDRVRNDLFKHRIESSLMQVAWWDGETRGNWLWGYVMMSFLSGHKEHQEHARDILEELKSTQDEDGYIGIYSEQSRYQHAGGENGELWTQSRALLPMLAYYEFSGDAGYLLAVERAVQLAMQHYAPPNNPFEYDAGRHSDSITGITHGLCYLDVLEWLFNITCNAQYRTFGGWLYQAFSSVPIPFENDDMAGVNLVNEKKGFAGHAVHTAEHLRAVLWASDDEAIKKNAIYKLLQYSLPNGALLGDESIHGTPIPDVGYEYCTLTEMLFSLASSIQKSGDATHGDWMENIAFNAAQGARLPDGRAISYLTSDSRLEAVASRKDAYAIGGSIGRFKFSPTHEDVACCCNPSAIRFMPHYTSQMWMGLSEEDGIAAVCYGPSSVEFKASGVPVRLVQETNYPFSNEIKFTVEAEAPVSFAFVLRKPGWATTFDLHAKDKAISEDSSWVTIRGIWCSGEIVTLNLEGGIRSVPYANGSHALFHGPLQFVLPLKSEMKPIKSYAVPHLHDLEVLPSNLVEDYLPVILDASKAGFGFEKEYRQQADPTNPWSDSPVTLTNGKADLIPMGCSVLRFAAFPLMA